MDVRSFEADACSRVHAYCYNDVQRMQVICEEIGESPLEVLSKLSTEIVLPLLRHQLKKGGAYPHATAVEVSDALQAFTSDGVFPPFSYCIKGTPLLHAEDTHAGVHDA